MKTGDLIKAETFSGEHARRRIVEIDGQTVYLCTEEEWNNAEKEKREPLSVGFNSRYIRALPESE